MKKVFTEQDREFISKNYPTRGALWVATRIGKTEQQIKSFVRRNKIKLPRREYKWTPEKTEKLIREFPHRKTADIAREMGFPYYTVSNKAYLLRLKKTDGFMRKYGNLLKGDKGLETRFKKGHIPANKGKKMTPELRERVKHTFFQKGQMPATTKYFGKPYLYETKNRDGNTYPIWWIQEGPNKRSTYLSYLCRQHGIDLKGKKPRLKPGFDHSHPPTIDDIAIVTNAENLKLNSMYRYPEEVVSLIHTKGALTRQINKRKKNEQ